MARLKNKNPGETCIFSEGYNVLIYQSNDCSILTKYLLLFDFAATVALPDTLIPKLKTNKFDICILDYAEGKPGDLSLLEYIRDINADIPIIFLADRPTDISAHYKYLLNAFKKGVDDFITRPYNMDELICRMRALLRRNNKMHKVDKVYKLGTYKYNTKDRMLECDSYRIKLTSTQSRILSILCAYMDEPVSKQVLLQEIYGQEEENLTTQASRVLSVYLSQLRNTLRFDSRIIIDTSQRNYIMLQVRDDLENESLF